MNPESKKDLKIKSQQKQIESLKEEINYLKRLSIRNMIKK
jgi:hypothetical protein